MSVTTPLPAGTPLSTTRGDGGLVGVVQLDVTTLPVSIAATVPVSLATAPTTPITAASLPLPAGASTETTLAAVSTNTAKIPAQGQALAAASLPVVLPAAQITSLTPLSSVGVNNFPATQAVSIATMPSTPVTGTFFQTTQPVSIAATVNVSTGLTQPLTDAQLRATAVPVSGTVTASQPANTSVGPTAFTATDAVVAAPIGDGTLISGASTAGSVIAIPIPSGFTAWTLLVKNWVSGTVYTEASFNSTNGTDGDWVEVKGRRTGTAPGTESVVYAMVANGYYRGNGAGFAYFRTRFIGAASFPTVQILLSKAAGAVFLNSGIPGGSSAIGSVTVTSAPTTAVTGAFFQSTQPVSIATMPSTPVTGTFWQATQPISGSVTVTSAPSTAVTNAGTFAVQAAQGAPNATPWNENIAQVGGTAIAVRAVPTGGSGLAAIPVYNNAVQCLTYTFGARNVLTGALVANTAKQVLSIEVPSTNTKTVKIRRILVSGFNSALLAGTLDFQVTRGSAATSGGTAVTAGVRVTGDTTPQTVVKSLPTITAATVLDTLPFAANGAAAASAQPWTVIYDWQEAGETKPWTLKPSVIDTFVLSAISTAAQNWTLTFHVTLTEE